MYLDRPTDDLTTAKSACASIESVVGPTSIKRCSRCLYHDDIPNIFFDEQGECSYCAMHEHLCQEYPLGQEGNQLLQGLVDQIKIAGKGKKYDCVIGVSGGCDSSFLLYKMKEMGLRPLAAHFDNTWNSAIATENIRKVTKKLDIDLFTIVVNNLEYDNLILSYLKAGTPDLECPTDIGLAVTHYKAAEKFGIKYIVEGHSFRTEGVSPLGWIYMDGKYIRSVQKRHGSRSLKTFPNMPLHLFLKWMTISRIKKVRPLYYIDYQKEDVKKFLEDEFGWEWYGGHHLENRLTKFYHSYFWPKRFGFDGRLLGYSALMRSGQLSRQEGLELISQPIDFDPEIVELFKKRLSLSDVDFEHYMTMPLRTYRDYPTYKTTFERLRPLFWLLYKLNLVPKSFYLKYTYPDPLPKWAQKAKQDPTILSLERGKVSK